MMKPIPRRYRRALSLALACVALLVGASTARAQCDLTIVPDTLRADYAGSPVGFCVDLDFRIALRSTRFVDGVRQTRMAEGCDFDTLTYYPYSTFPDAGQAGPYRLESWMIGGATVSGDFATISELVTLINDLDPLGNWIDDPLTRNLVGGVSGEDYGVMTVRQLNTGTTREVSPNFQAVANGTLVVVDGPGVREYVIDDPATGCRDTLILVLDPRINDERFDVFTDFNATSPVFCLDNGQLLGVPQPVMLCGPAPVNGTVLDQGGYCYTYTPNAGFSGSEDICFEVCDDSAPPLGPLCQRTIVTVITRSPANVMRDTVSVQISPLDTTVCLNDVLQIPQPYDVAELCAPAPSGVTAVPQLDGCVSLQPDPGFGGSLDFCVRYCNGATCDTTVLRVDVLDNCSLGMFADGRDTIAGQGDPTPYCISVVESILSTYELRIDGQLYTGPYAPCDTVEEHFYNYAPLFGSGGAGPYTLVSWTVDGQSTNGTFQDPDGLEALMRQFDPAGNWRLDAANFNIQGGNPASVYGMMRIVHDGSGTLSELLPNPIDVVRGASIELPGDGTYDIQVVDPASGCTDAVLVTVGAPPSGGTVTQTIRVDVAVNGVSDRTCLFATPRDTSFSCGDVRNGTVAVDADVCAVYTPDPGFVGADTLCYVSCDLPGATVCDTTLVVYTVRVSPDTVFVNGYGDDAFTACAMPPFAGPYAPAQFCGTTGPFTATASPTGGCIVIDPDDGATADGEVCVEICQLADPSVCQQVTFVISQTPACTPALFAQDTVNLPASTGAVRYCLADGADLSQYTIAVNGLPVTPLADTSCGTTTGGGGGTRDAYFYGTFLLQDVEYRIDAWDINGDLVMGVIAPNFAALADSMSAYDPLVDWTYDAVLGGIVGSAATGNYSSLFLFDPAFGSTTEVALQTIQVGTGGGTFVPGAVLELPTAGVYEVEVIADDGSCGERQVIIREFGSTPVRDTVRLNAQEDQLNGPYCLDTSELPNAPTSIESCGDPQSGALAFTTLECFTYEPDAGFSGSDTACVVICSDNGLVCDTTIVIFEVTGTPTGCDDFIADADLETVTTDCDALTDVCLPRLPGDAFNYSLTVDGVLRTDAVACGADTVTIYSYADVAGRGQAGPYAVEDYRLGAEVFNGDVADVLGLVDSLNAWDPAGNWMLNAGTFTIRGGVSGFAYDTLVLRQIATDTLNRLVPVTTLRENRLGVPLDTGAHEVIVTDLVTGCTDTLTYTVACVSDVDCGDFVLVTDTLLTAADCAADAAFTISSPVTDPAELEVFVNGVATSAVVSGTELTTRLDTGTYVVVVFDATRDCSTEYTVSVDCAACPAVLPDAIARGVDCSAGSLAVCLPLPPAALQGFAFAIDGEAYTGTREPCDEQTRFAIDVLELPDAGLAGPYRVDSFRIGAEVFAADFATVAGLTDSLNRWDVLSDWRYDTTGQLIIGGDVDADYSPLFVTQIASGESVALTLEERTEARGTLITLDGDPGQRELVLDDGAGCTQAVTLELVCVTSERLSDTIAVTASATLCVDASELTGPIVSLVNACPDGAGVVLFDFDAVPGCVVATGLEVGESTACLVACDAAGVCDTTFYTVVVTPPAGDVVAVDDAYDIVRGETVQRAVTANDTFGVLTSIRIVEQPARGTAFLDDTGVLTYTPDQDECGFTDSLVYEICSGTLCDQATVSFRVRCELVEPYTGFSPNGDGVNETFVILGIDEFPGAEVRVYNRWGNEVFSATDYQNDWRGTWDGNRLVSGTYFYVIDLNDGSDALAGYVQLFR